MSQSIKIGPVTPRYIRDEDVNRHLALAEQALEEGDGELARTHTLLAYVYATVPVAVARVLPFDEHEPAE